MDFLDQIVGQINEVLWSYVLIVMLLGLGVFFTLRTGFVQDRKSVV